MTRQDIREQFIVDGGNEPAGEDGSKVSRVIANAANQMTCALLCVAYAIGDLAEAVWAQSGK